MILSVVYSKSTGDIVVSSDIDEIAVEVNQNEITDNDSELSFEIAVDVSEFQLMYEEIIEDGDNNE